MALSGLGKAPDIGSDTSANIADTGQMPKVEKIGALAQPPKKSFLHNSGYGCVHFVEAERNSIVVLARNGSVRASIRVGKQAKTSTNETTFAIKLSKKQTSQQSKRKEKKVVKPAKASKSKPKNGKVTDEKKQQISVPEVGVFKEVNQAVRQVEEKEENVTSELKPNPSFVTEVNAGLSGSVNTKANKLHFSTRSGTRRSVRRGSGRKSKLEDTKTAKSESANRSLTSNANQWGVKGLPALAERDEKLDTGVYGSVKSLVKQAIKNFEKLDSAAKAEQHSFDQTRTKSMPTAQTCETAAHSTLSLPSGPGPQPHVTKSDESYACVEDDEKPVLILAPPAERHNIESSDYERWNAEIVYSNTEEAMYANCGPLASAPMSRDNEPSAGSNLKPNSSFLWSGKSKQIYQDIYLPLSDRRPPDGYDEIGNVATQSSSNYDDIKSSPSVGYDDVKPPSVGYDDVKPPSVAYDDVKAPSVSYDDLKQNYEEARLCTTYYNASQAPSVRYDDIRPGRRRQSCLYDDLRPPSSNGYISPPSVVTSDPSSLVTAVPAVITEDQIDSLSYFYDDIGAHVHRTYERIGHINNSPEENNQRDKQEYGWFQQDQDDELFTYKLPKPPVVGAVPDSPAPSIARSRSVAERRSDTSDEWMDFSDVETEEGVSIDQSPSQGSKFARNRRSRSTRRASRVPPRKAGKSWTRAFRDFFKITTSKSPDYEPTISVHRQPSTSSAASSYSTLNIREGEPEIVIQEESTNYYETLYEVINNNLTPVPDHVSDDFEDSFESEDDIIRETSQDAVSQKSRDSGNASSYGLSKITEAANKKMRHFRHHLTSRKMDLRSELSNTFSRMRKRSTVSTMDLADLFKKNPNGDVNDVTSKTVSDTSLNEPRISLESPPKMSVDGKKNGTWKLPNLKRKSLKRDSSTFYLTLTVESDEKHDSGFFNKDDSDSLPSIGSCRSLSSTSPNASSNVAKTAVAARGRRPSSAYDVVRPRTAPPPPPPIRHEGETNAPPSYPPPPIPDGKLKTIGGVKVMDVSAPELLLRRQLNSASDTDLTKSIESELKNRVSTLTASSCSYIQVANSISGHDFVYESSQKNEHPHGDEEYKASQFSSEPLYQFYTASILDRAILDDEDSEEDDYEVIRPADEPEAVTSEVETEKPPLPHRQQTAMELVEPSDGTRTLWCQLPAVISSGALGRLSIQARKKQEAMFEVITSEASYLRSLNVLVNHFMNALELSGDLDSVISKRDRHLLFSDLLPVQLCSERFLADLEKRWQESIVISDICDIILSHAEQHFDVYVKYCSHQLYQERTLKELKDSNPAFSEVLRRLESDSVCQSLAMHSFLMLPMQRITRLPLLVDAIYHRMDFSCAEFETCKMALATLNKIVKECNEGARKMERYEEMLVISRQLEFKDVKAVPLISSARWLVKRGEFTRVSWKEGAETKLTFGRKMHKATILLYLFTDLLLVVKKKGEECFHVIDYCLRNMAQLTDLLDPEVLAKGESGKNLLLLTMLQNHENKTTEMVLSCNLESNRTRWLEAMTPKTSDNPDEVIYEEWDCPQVQVIHPYTAQQNDELSLQVADVVNVLRKMADGWYEGERIRDRERGWFPGNYAEEIASVHVRAKNLKQRWRLLALSGNFLARQQEEQVKRKSSFLRPLNINLSIEPTAKN